MVGDRYCNLHIYLVDTAKTDILLLYVIGCFTKLGKHLGDIVIPTEWKYDWILESCLERLTDRQ